MNSFFLECLIHIENIIWSYMLHAEKYKDESGMDSALKDKL